MCVKGNRFKKRDKKVMIWMRGMQKGEKQFYRGLAVLMSVILLLGQYSFPVKAEEGEEVSDITAESGTAEKGGSVSGGDVGTVRAAEEYTDSVSGGNADPIEEFTIDGIQYKLLSSAEVEIVKADDTASLNNVVIPIKVESPDNAEYEVVSIGPQAFVECESLESIRIPSGVKSIGYCTFWNCRNLKSVQLQEGITSIETGAFGNCESLEDMQIPGSVLNIGQEAFSGCKRLESVSMQRGIADIGVRAFSGCMNLRDIQLPDSIVHIGQSAFEKCESLESIEIPDGVLNIGSSAFYGCKNLKNVKIPDGITRLEDWAFGECESLGSIKIPDSVTAIGEGAFIRCKALKDVFISNHVTKIEDKAFCGCEGLESIDILGSVECIGQAAFTSCNNLRILRIAVKTEEADGRKKVKPIILGEDAFDNDASDSLREITFLTEDGTAELSDTTIPTLAEAREAYRNVNDGDSGDNYWYGWYLGEASAIEDKDPVHSVTIQVYIDDEERADHGRIFMLKRADADTWVADLNRVSNGSYEIYDVTGAQSRAAGMTGLNTKVTVEINGQDAIARVDYYTVSFYDGEALFEANTLQGPQTILKGYPASRPGDPVKEGAVFKEWVTGAQKDEAFDFHREIQEKTAIYAAWRAKEPDKPEEGDKPGEPEEEDGPGEPDKPEEDGRPGEQDKPEEGSRPGEPDEPEGGNTSAEPDKPAGGDTSGESDTPTGGDIPADANTAGSENSTENNNGYPVNTNRAGGNNEPKTGDDSHAEVYATIAMIAGMLYLLLYFADQEKGMTEEKKKELVSALIRWAKGGSCLRRYAAIAAIFCLLCYYHSIGKSDCAKHGVTIVN